MGEASSKSSSVVPIVNQDSATSAGNQPMPSAAAKPMKIKMGQIMFTQSFIQQNANISTSSMPNITKIDNQLPKQFTMNPTSKPMQRPSNFHESLEGDFDRDEGGIEHSDFKPSKLHQDTTPQKRINDDVMPNQ